MDLLLNTPTGLSLVDDFVLKNIPETARSGVIVHAGTDRLSKAIKKKLGDSISIYNIEERTPLFDLLNHDEFRAQDVWDVDWYTQIAKKHGGIDFIFFLNIHEYWHGNLLSLRKILQLLSPKGVGFLSFYNKNSLYEIRQNLPPFVCGIEQLALPMGNWAKLDLASWMIYFTDINFPLTHVWGMLEEDAFSYCSQSSPEKTLWRTKGLDIKIRDVSDAFVLGAPVMCLRFQKSDTSIFEIPQFIGTKYDASLLQAILFPYISILPNELDVLNAQLDADNYSEEEEDSLVLLNFFISQLEDFKDIKTVLIIGCNCGISLLDLKKIKPQWKITGVDSSKEVIASGAQLMRKAGIDTLVYGSNGQLPFQDSAFDLVISLKHFSCIHEPLAEQLAKEMLRVSKKGIAQIEDIRGPKLSMQFKFYSIPDIYLKLKQEPEAQFIKIGDKSSGFYILKVKKAP